MSLPAEPQSPANRTEPPAGPYLCDVSDQIPDGWQRARALDRTDICLAFDPSRHTVVQNLDSKNHEHLAAIAEQAGFKLFQVPDSANGFFARDRHAPPQSTAEHSHQGMSR